MFLVMWFVVFVVLSVFVVVRGGVVVVVFSFVFCVKICSGKLLSVFLRDCFLLWENDDRERNEMVGCMENMGDMSCNSEVLQFWMRMNVSVSVCSSGSGMKFLGFVLVCKGLWLGFLRMWMSDKSYK